MWRDIERRAAARGLNASLPAPYPVADAILANKVAQVAVDADWGRPWLKAAYRAWFEDGLSHGGEDNLNKSLAAVGQDPAAVIAEAETDAIHAKIVASTDEARNLGVFGAPSFTVDGELFWGDDRIDDAARWAKTQSA